MQIKTMTPLNKLEMKTTVIMKVSEANQSPIFIIFFFERPTAEISGIRKGIIGHLFQSPLFIIEINSTNSQQIKHCPRSQLPSHSNFISHYLNLFLRSPAQSGPVRLPWTTSTASQSLLLSFLNMSFTVVTGMNSLIQKPSRCLVSRPSVALMTPWDGVAL